MGGSTRDRSTIGSNEAADSVMPWTSTTDVPGLRPAPGDRRAVGTAVRCRVAVALDPVGRMPSPFSLDAITSERASGTTVASPYDWAPLGPVLSRATSRRGPRVDDDVDADRGEVRSQFDTDGCDPHAYAAHAPGQDRPLRPPTRARLVRCLLRRQPARCAIERTRAHRPDGIDEPRAPRCDRCRIRHRRRRRHPPAGPRRARTGPSSPFDLPAAGTTPPGSRSCPTDDVAFEKAIAVDRVGDGRRRARRSSVGVTCPIDPTCLGTTALAAMPRFRQLFVDRPGRRDRHRPRPQGVRRPQAVCAAN